MYFFTHIDSKKLGTKRGQISIKLLTQFGVQKESMTGIATAPVLPTFSFWVSVVQLQVPETHVSFRIFL